MPIINKTLNGNQILNDSNTHINDLNTRHVTDTEKSSWNGKANASGTYSSLISGGNRIHDTRGENRPPNYYPGNTARWDFVESAKLGCGGDGWTGLLTISPWSEFNTAHRQQQLAFLGSGGLKFRSASSATAWYDWVKVYTSATKPTPSEIGALGNSGGQTLTTNGTSTSSGLILKGTNVTGKFWTGTGGFVVQTDGTATLHLGCGNATDMVFSSANIQLGKNINANNKEISSVSKINGYSINTNTTANPKGCIPTINSNGTMEISQFLDFHTASGVDYTNRIYSVDTGVLGLRNSSSSCMLSFYKNDGSCYGYVGNGAPENDDFYIVSQKSNYVRCGGNFVPQTNRAWWIGTNSPQQQWKGLCAEGGVIGASDAKLKENIFRLNGNHVIVDETGSIKDISMLRFSNEEVSSRATSQDYYAFMKDRFKPTYYNYKSSGENGIETEKELKLLKNIGFIAQDYNLEEDKVAKEFIIQNEDGSLLYNHMSYVTVGMVALQETIMQLEKVKREKEELEVRLRAIEEKLGL